MGNRATNLLREEMAAGNVGPLFRRGFAGRSGKSPFDDAVLEAVEADDAQPAPRCQRRDCLRQRFLQHLQLVVNLYAQRLRALHKSYSPLQLAPSPTPPARCSTLCAAPARVTCACHMGVTYSRYILSLFQKTRHPSSTQTHPMRPPHCSTSCSVTASGHCAEISRIGNCIHRTFTVIVDLPAAVYRHRVKRNCTSVTAVTACGETPRPFCMQRQQQRAQPASMHMPTRVRQSCSPSLADRDQRITCITRNCEACHPRMHRDKLAPCMLRRQASSQACTPRRQAQHDALHDPQTSSPECTPLREALRDALHDQQTSSQACTRRSTLLSPMGR